MTTHTVFCTKLQIEAEGLDSPPYPGALGEKIYHHISKKAWQEWLNHQTTLINEYRLSMVDPKARAFLLEEMQKFLFEGGGSKPSGYVEPSQSE